MNTHLPLVSVIIPAYNRDRYLAEAIESVLAQTYPAIELIVVDDGSSDRTAEVAQRYALTYHFQPNGGISAARNAGIALATGEFLAFLDSDDIWMLDKLSKQMIPFGTDLDLEAVFGYAEQFYSPELDDTFRQRIRCPEQPIAAHRHRGDGGRIDLTLRSGHARIPVRHRSVGADLGQTGPAFPADRRELAPDVPAPRAIRDNLVDEARDLGERPQCLAG